MSCHDCGNENNDCGCSQEALHISQVCNPIDCSTEECSESFPSQCILYTGDDIICNNTTLVTSGDNIAQAIANIIAFFCTQDGVDADIVCGNDTIVTAETSINDALDQIVAYFCNAITALTDGALTTVNVGVVNTPDAGEPLCTDSVWTVTFLDAQSNQIDQIQFSTRTCEPRELCSIILNEPAGTDSLILCRNGDIINASYQTLLDAIDVAAQASNGMFAQTANSATVVDPTPGSIIGAGEGSLTVPMNTFAIGDSFRAKLAGHITCSNTQELTIFVQDGNGNTIASTGLIDLKTATDSRWNLEIDFTIRSIGGAGSLVSAGMWTYVPDSGGQAFEGGDFSDINPIDTTIDNTLVVIASFNLPEGGTNSIYSELLTLTKMY